MKAVVRFGPASEGGRSEAPRPPRRRARREGAALVLAALALLVMTASALAATGDLTQPAATSSCWSEGGAGQGPCADGRALISAQSVAISPDGKNVYVASPSSDAVAVFSRNLTTGVLTQLASTAGCVSETGSGPCADGRALDGANAVAVSPDGKNVYVASTASDAVARFNRNATTGTLTQPAAATAGCVSETGAGPCADGRALMDASSVAVSADGKSVYTTSPGSEPTGTAADGIARFNRVTTGPTTGTISQPTGGTAAGCWTDSGSGGLCADGKALGGAYSVAVSADGKSVYVAARDSAAVTRFTRNTAGAIVQTANCVSETGFGPCTDGKALGGASSVVVSPDGKSVYVGSTVSDAVARFNRNTTSGAITQPAAGTTGCVSETGAGPCADGRALLMANSFGSRFVAVSGDGKNVYVASSNTGDGAVARFNRTTTGPATGAITQPAAAAAGCISEFGASGTCADGRALRGATSVAISASGAHVYVASFVSQAVALLNRAP
jgi:DNA-binding beta-propeller fold protein YncE